MSNKTFAGLSVVVAIAFVVCIMAIAIENAPATLTCPQTDSQYICHIRVVEVEERNVP